MEVPAGVHLGLDVEGPLAVGHVFENGILTGYQL